MVRPVFSVWLVVLGVASSCKREVTCETAIDKMKECGVAAVKSGDRDALVAECEKAAKTDRLALFGPCLDVECGQFESCMEEQKKQAARSRSLEAIARAKETRAFDAASALCDPAAVASDPALAQPCQELARLAVEDFRKRLLVIRDRNGSGGAAPCFSMQRFAKLISTADAKAAEGFCEELSIAEEIGALGAALPQARVDGTVPFQCGHLIERLTPLRSDWARVRLTEVNKTCWLDLGRAVLEKRLPAMKYGCNFHVKQVLAGLKQSGLGSPETSALLASDVIRTLCSDP